MKRSHNRIARLILVVGLALTLTLSASCGIDFAYILPTFSGELAVVLGAVPIEQAIASDDITPDQADRLRLILDVRDFAGETIGLNVTNQYSTFYNAGEEPVAFNISASRRDRFEPFIWSFPIVGSVPFLIYFDQDQALARRTTLLDSGYDVFIYEVDAYFAGGFIPNPILSPMLERPEESLIDTVIHELLHATISRLNDASFNESLATFVGRTGALQYIDTHFADEPERHDLAVARFEDSDRYSEFLLSLYNDLDTYYASDLSDDAKILGRDAVFQAGRDRFVAEVLPLMNIPANYEWVADLPVNNALMLGVRRYNLDLAVFQRVFDDLGGDWYAALDVYRDAANASDSYQYLRDWNVSDMTAKTPDSAENTAIEAVSPDGYATCSVCRKHTVFAGTAQDE